MDNLAMLHVQALDQGWAGTVDCVRMLTPEQKLAIGALLLNPEETAKRLLDEQQRLSPEKQEEAVCCLSVLLLMAAIGYAEALYRERERHSEQE